MTQATDPFKKEPGARVTIAPWADDDGVTVIAAMGDSACSVVLRSKSLPDLISLAAAHIDDLKGDPLLVAELEERAKGLEP